MRIFFFHTISMMPRSIFIRLYKCPCWSHGCRADRSHRKKTQADERGDEGVSVGQECLSCQAQSFFLGISERPSDVLRNLRLRISVQTLHSRFVPLWQTDFTFDHVQCTIFVKSDVYLRIGTVVRIQGKISECEAFLRALAFPCFHS